MTAPLVLLAALRHCFLTATVVLLDLGRLVVFVLRSRRALAAENLFLRKQLAVFQERRVKPRRANDATRWMMAALSRMARRSVECKTGYSHPLAPERIPPVLALEIHADGKTAPPNGPASTHPGDGSWQCHLGRGTNRQRVETRARYYLGHREEVEAHLRMLESVPNSSSGLRKHENG